MALKRVDYDDRQHRVYAQARAMDPAMLARWMSVFAEQLPPRRPLRMLDLGSGTGRFTPALARTFGGPAIGVEPSDGMRSVAEAAASAPDVTYLAGEAAAIPLAGDAVDAALMFLSFHHVPDRAAAALEIARVLAPGGRVLMRGNFRDRMPPVWWTRFFPSAEAIELQVYPSIAEVTAAFAAAGLAPLGLVEVTENYSPTPQAAVARLKLRGISTFEHLDEAEIEAGFALLDREVASGAFVPPLTGRSDLLVLG